MELTTLLSGTASHLMQLHLASEEESRRFISSTQSHYSWTKMPARFLTIRFVLGTLKRKVRRARADPQWLYLYGVRSCSYCLKQLTPLALQHISKSGIILWQVASFCALHQ
ncbi:hypothetical protein L917_17357 [Phytophthora nicotianae]|uniref:Uncharacterized protein n=1 Tax=Phytophthora nicotianae TaxID=4792 RepID=W2KBF0_PHYNI|nr:hypothetical protein L917_17357 [Phytophthora nicotianae]